MKNFPKTRIALPAEYQEIYTQWYKLNREGKTKVTYITSWLEGWLHKKVAVIPKNTPEKYKTLEIGAGTLNQLKFEDATMCQYDVIEPFVELYIDSPYKNNINAFYNDISDIKGNAVYDRITSVAVFEHICDLPTMLEHVKRLLKPNGVLQVGIPSEGEFGWSMGEKFSTAISFKRKYGLDYKVLRKYEHVNTAREIEEVIAHYFTIKQHNCFGLSKKLSFYQYMEATQKKSLK